MKDIETLIPKKVRNLMRSTDFANNPEFYKDIPKNFGLNPVNTKNVFLIWKWMKDHKSEKKEVENYWITVRKEQKERRNKYK